MRLQSSALYIGGQRKKYYNPLRIFIISLFTLFTVVLLKINDSINELNEFTTQQQEEIWAENMMLRYDSLVQEKFTIRDSLLLKQDLFELSTSQDSIDVSELTDESIEELNDVLDDIEVRDAAFVEPLLDSLKEKQSATFTYNYTSESGEEKKHPINDSGVLFPGFKTSELYRLDAETLKSKYGEGLWYKEKGFEQLQKVFMDFSGSLKFLISNGTWAIIATILFMALIFKLLYIRHNYLYAEHFIFHLYGHTRMLLALLFILLVNWIVESSTVSFILTTLWFIGSIVYLYIGMKRYYMQSRGKTVLKFLFTAALAYPFIISTCIALIFFLSLVFL